MTIESVTSMEKWRARWDAYEVQRREMEAERKVLRQKCNLAKAPGGSTAEEKLRKVYREAMADAFGEDLDELRHDENFQASDSSISMLVDFLEDGVEVLSAEQRQQWNS